MRRFFSAMAQVLSAIWKAYMDLMRALSPKGRIIFHVLGFHGLLLAWVTYTYEGLPSLPKPQQTVAVTTIRLAPPPPPPKPKAVVKKPTPKAVAVKKKQKPPPVEKAKPKPKSKPVVKQAPAPKKESKPREEVVAKTAPPIKKSPPTPKPSPKASTVVSNKRLIQEYQDTLSLFLQSALRLPDFGAIRVGLLLAKDGKVLDVEILDQVSEENRIYVEKRLPQLRFPSIAEAYPEVEKERFVITLSNDL